MLILFGGRDVNSFHFYYASLEEWNRKTRELDEFEAALAIDLLE